MKLVVMILLVMCISLFPYATGVLADDRDQKIEMLEALLEQYLEENRELKSRVEALERSPTASAAARATTCADDPTKCDDKVLCSLAATQVGNTYVSSTRPTSYVWSTQPTWKNHVREAQKRGLNCKVSVTANRQENSEAICGTDPSACSDKDLCELATFGISKRSFSKFSADQIFVGEAKKRGLDCGVKVVAQSPTQAEPTKPQSIAVNEDAVAAEQKRLADENKKKADAVAESETQHSFQLIPAEYLSADVTGKSCNEALASWKGQREPTSQKTTFMFPMIVYHVNNQLSKVNSNSVYHPLCDQAWIQDSQKHRYPYKEGKCVSPVPVRQADYINKNSVGTVIGWQFTLISPITLKAVTITQTITSDYGKVVELTNTVDGRILPPSRYYKCTAP